MTEPETGERYRYGVYGIAITSDTRLPLPEYAGGGFAQVECLTAPASVFLTATRDARFDSAPDSWYQYAVLQDGSTYVRWDSVGEFLVSANGRQLVCRRAEESSDESFQVYMLAQALSFALVTQGVEPLHATVVVVDGRAVAFLGGHSFGKSTLAACFLDGGYRQLTDDLLVVKTSCDGVVAYPGAPRIKLFSKVANRFTAYPMARVRMNGGTDKHIVPLEEQSSCAIPVKLEAIYSLAAPRDACRTTSASIEPLSRREAFLALVKGTFNRRVVSQERLARQFSAMAGLADLIPVKTLSYPRMLDRLPEVRDAVLADHAQRLD
jgi:hypothetical protein